MKERQGELGGGEFVYERPGVCWFVCVDSCVKSLMELSPRVCSLGTNQQRGDRGGAGIVIKAYKLVCTLNTQCFALSSTNIMTSHLG